MEARPCQVVEFFNGSKQMLVPLFQRPYEWKKPNWDALWVDLLERHERAEQSSDVSHFTGAIVTAPAKSVPVGVNKFLVIDGQQRLTTVTLLLLAIRSHLPADGKEYRKVTKLLVNDDEDGLDYYKLMPTQPDRAAFQALVKEPATAPTSLFLEAYHFFRERLEGKDSDGQPLDPWRLFETLQTRLHVVLIHLGEADDPYLIFESLNAKGSPLTQADLVRNYLLLRLHNQEQQRVYQEHWLPMQDRLGDNLTEFMRHYLMMSGDEVAKGEIYTVLKRRLQDIPDSKVSAEISRMNAASEHYLRIISPEHETHPGMRRGLSRLKRWEVATSHPLLMRMHMAYGEGKFSAEEFVECLSILESFAVRRAVCGVPTNKLKRIFLMLTRIVSGTEIPETLRANLAAGTAGSRWPKDDEFQEAWTRFRAYGNPVDRCKFILESLEDNQGHKEPASYAKATIEHVMPQTLTDEWRETLGSKADELHERWLDTIGNLTLTGYNPELSNSPFSEKQQLFTQSHFGLNMHFAAHAVWGPEEIAARAARLWESARNIWHRPTA